MPPQYKPNQSLLSNATPEFAAGCAQSAAKERLASSSEQLAPFKPGADLTGKGSRAIILSSTPRGYQVRRKIADMEVMNEGQLISDFVERRVWAVVGASQNPAKFGYRVFRNLQEAGYVVYAVNPRGGELLQNPVYPTLADLPEPPEVVDTVVPPAVTEQIVKEMHEQGLSRVWMQPGSESEAAIDYCREHGIQVVYDACAMVHRRQWN